jgi:hypothetical protein
MTGYMLADVIKPVLKLDNRTLIRHNIAKLMRRIMQTRHEAAIELTVVAPRPKIVLQKLVLKETLREFIYQFPRVEFNRTLLQIYNKRIFTNTVSSETNHPENEITVGKMSAVIWLQVFNYLDVPSLLQASLTCLKVNYLSINRESNSRIYDARFFNISRTMGQLYESIQAELGANPIQLRRNGF